MATSSPSSSRPESGYTDGLTEARRDGRLLGEGRVRAILSGLAGRPAAEIAAALEQASEEWGAGRKDDLALLVLKVPA